MSKEKLNFFFFKTAHTVLNQRAMSISNLGFMQNKSMHYPPAQHNKSGYSAMNVTDPMLFRRNWA